MRKMSRIVLGVLAVAVFGLTPLVAAAANQAKAKKTVTTAQAFTRTETLVGKISMVQAQKGLVVVKDSNGVPFDFKATHAKVEVNGHKSKMANLSEDINRPVTVKYLPFPSGDRAQTIVVKG